MKIKHRLILAATVAVSCLLICTVEAQAQRPDEVGRMIGAEDETLYLAATVEDARLFGELHSAREAFSDGLEGGQASVDLAQARIKPLIQRKHYVSVSPGALVARIGKIDGELLTPTIYKVVVLSGPQKGWVGFTPIFASMAPRGNEDCTLFPDSGYKYAFGAFNEYAYEQFWDEMYKGDKRGAAGYLALEQVIGIAPGTRGYGVETKEGMCRVRISSGKHKGKLLWFDEDCCRVVDTGTFKTLLAGLKKTKLKSIKPLPDPPPPSPEEIAKKIAQEKAVVEADYLPYKSLQIDGESVNFHYSLSSIYLLQERSGASEETWHHNTATILAETKGELLDLKSKSIVVDFKSENPAILDFKDKNAPGSFTALKPGETNIHVTYGDKSVSIPIVVVGIPVAFHANPKEVSDKLGDPINPGNSGKELLFFSKYPDASLVMYFGEAAVRVISDGWHLLERGKFSGAQKQLPAE